MAIINWPHGIGEATGDKLATCSPLEMQLTAGVIYVHHTGSDLYEGTDRTAPVATLGQANLLTGVGDMIVMLSGHTEKIAAAVDLEGKILIGAGTSGGFPTVQLTNDQAAGSMLTVSSTYPSQILNVRLKEEAQDNSEPKIRVPVTAGAFDSYLRIRGCYIECGAHDLGPGLLLGGGEGDSGFVEIRETTFISTATSIAALPLCAIVCDSTTTLLGLIMDGVVFDNGPYGWYDALNTTRYALDLSARPIDRLHLERLTFSHGADANLGSHNAGYVNVYPSYGGGRIDWV